MACFGDANDAGVRIAFLESFGLSHAFSGERLGKQIAIIAARSGYSEDGEHRRFDEGIEPSVSPNGLIYIADCGVGCIPEEWMPCRTSPMSWAAICRRAPWGKSLKG